MKYLGLILLATSVTCRFTDDLYKLLAKSNAGKNLISSPLSVDIALSMVYMAAGGKTAQEMRNVLKHPTDKKAVARKYKEFLTRLEGREKVAILDLANRIFVNDRYTIVPQFNQFVKDSFKAEAQAVSLTDSEKAASIVNKWVNDQTRSRIKTVVENNDMSSRLIMVLVNAIYFKGQWQYEFDPKRTKVGDFRSADKNTVPVQMMSLVGTFRVGLIPDLDARVIELPYRNSSLSMVIFLPEKVDGLPELEEKIAGFSQKLNSRVVQLRMPKFKIEFSSELKGILATMGIRDAFTGGADFRGLVKPSGASITKVTHKAFIEVNEQGAEAAAVTGAGIVSRCPTCNAFRFNVDHPFAYVIRDEDTIYFQGHFVKP